MQALRTISTLTPVTPGPRSAIAREWRRFERMLAPCGQRVLDRATLVPGQRVIDAGCGAGGLTLQAAHHVREPGLAIGVDPDPFAIAVASKRAREQALAQAHFALTPGSKPLGTREPVFDALVSRFGITRFSNPGATIAQLAAALVPGARVSLSLWRAPSENPWFSLPRRVVSETLGSVWAADESPFALGSRDAIERAARRAGLVEIQIEPCDFELWMGDDVDDALEFFFEVEGRSLDAGIDEPALRRLTAALRRAFAAHESASGVQLGAAAWLLTARAPGSVAPVA